MVQDLYLGAEGLQRSKEAARISTNPFLCTRKRHLPEFLPTCIRLHTLSFHYLYYTSPISQTHQYSKPSSGPQGRHRKHSRTSKRYLRQQIHHHSQRGAFLSEQSPTCDASSRHGCSINHTAPPCSHQHLLHSPKVSRPQRPRI